MLPSTIIIGEIADQLQRVGYIVLDKPLLDELPALLLARCQNDGSAGKGNPTDGNPRFRSAHIGRGMARRQDIAIRGDVISWLDNTHSIDETYLAWMEQLRLGLNAALYLGLFEFECHYAIYGAGNGYGKHSDVLGGSKNRILSTVLYLNEEWQTCDGGVLLLFDPSGDKVIAKISPSFGTMIIFLSECFPHQVCISNAPRRSVAGWFRGRERV